MNALDYFMDYYNCSKREELSKKIQTYGTYLQIPPHRCAHTKQKIFKYISKIKILDFIPGNSEHLICLCIPEKINNSFYDEAFYEDGAIYDELFYLHLEDIIICPPNANNCLFSNKK